ncbi:hypothetical protein ACF08W_31465 [Streptomyces sp. NPDC015144]|uniref:hypothetical protein n=1 Tax=Streptomyces sp. NPDC015144 TaxID=3364944 RepID=UPI0036F6E7C0
MKAEFPKSPSEAELAAKTMVQIWAEAVVRQAAVARANRKKDDAAFRNYERGETWSPDFEDELGATWRTRWASEHILVWSAHQLERWAIRLADLQGTEQPEENKKLKAVRDALEHLDEADLTETTATAPTPQRKNDPKGRALRNDFPNESMSLGLGGRKLFDLLDPEELDKTALKILRQIRKEVDLERVRKENAEVSAYVDMLMER